MFLYHGSTLAYEKLLFKQVFVYIFVRIGVFTHRISSTSFNEYKFRIVLTIGKYVAHNFLFITSKLTHTNI